MILVEPTLADVLRMAVGARPDERAQWESLSGEEWDPDRIAVDHFTRPGIRYALVDEGTNEAIVVGGYSPIGPQVWQSWMIGTPENWERHWFAITKHTRRVMDGLLKSGARRLQTTALASRERAIHWYVKGLGMTQEGVMRGYGANGEDVALFARLKGE